MSPTGTTVYITRIIIGLMLAVPLITLSSGCDSDTPQPASDVSQTSNLTDTATTGNETNNPPAAGAPQQAIPQQAMATLSATDGHQANGTVTFTDSQSGTQVSVRLNGLQPGQHGFHIHAKGDCSAADASSAGGHFSPDNNPHGAPDAEAHHVGDLGNIVADQQGTVQNTRMFDSISLNGSDSILGKAVIVHSNADDLQSQPSGAAGERIACGVIESVAVQRTID